MTVDIASLKYDAQGLITAVLQDAQTHEVVMVGYMNADTLRQTMEIGQAVFWSRSRQEVWHKGATSGDYVQPDVLLLQVELLGGGVCHTGTHSCFVEADDVTPRGVQA